MHTNVIN